MEISGNYLIVDVGGTSIKVAPFSALGVSANMILNHKTGEA